MKKNAAEELRRLMALDAELTNRDTGRTLVRAIPFPDLTMFRAGSRAHQWESLKWSIAQASAHGVNGLTGLAVALSRVIVADSLKCLVMDAREHQGCKASRESLLWPRDTIISGQSTSMRDLLHAKTEPLIVDTGCTAVIPAPWERRRTIKAMANLGAARPWGSWRQNKRNHHGVAWSPWPLVWVDNGNHSTLASLFVGGGRFRCSEHLDAHDLLDAVTTDGMNWIRTDTQRAFARVESLPMAAIFMLGKELQKL